MTYRDIDPKLAGIYIIKNNINGKCYIGQSVKLRSRIKSHMKNIETHKLDLPLYRAVWKYGWHNFTLELLESFVPDPNITNEDLIKILDKLEIEYIEKYNAYTEGYNCTKGGDYGVLGLKMTEDQKKKVKASLRKSLSEGCIGKRVYMYNFVEKYHIYAWTITDASNITRLSRSNISRLCNNNYIHPYCNNFIASFTKEELEEKKLHCEDYIKEIENKASLKKGRTSINKGKYMYEDQKLKIKKALQKKYVLQYDLSYNLIKQFDSVEEAAKTINTREDSIRKACRGVYKTHKRFIWRYKDKVV